MPKNTKYTDVFKKFNTSPKGLSSQEVVIRLKKYGLNEIKAQKKDPLWLKFLRQFTDLMVLVLIGAALVSIIVAVIQKHYAEMSDAYIILGIVFLNAIIGFVQEYKAEKALEALQRLIAPKTRVMRNGQEQIIESKYLVPGDIIILAEGDKISADGRLFEVNELKVEESALTGESVPILKSTDIIEKTNTTIHDTHNLVYMGTTVASGSSKAIVVKTGMNTEFGKIAHMTVSTKKDKSPLQKELYRIGLFVGKITFVISLILFFVGIYYQDYSIVESILFSVAVAVAAVPEGLPATITIALALGIQRLAKKNAIIKQLSSVETLGSTTVICSDKTGTLTKNEMTVTEIQLGIEQTFIFEGSGYSPVGDIQYPKKYNQKDFHKLLEIASICNEAKHVQIEKRWNILGDPTEGALLVAAKKAGLDYEKSNIERLQIFPFDSARKCMSTVVKIKSSNPELFVKGAPDIILQLCNKIQIDGKIVPLTSAHKKSLEKNNQTMAEKALRVLAVAYRPNIPQKKLHNAQEYEQDLVFLGLIGMIDPPRLEVKNAVNLCNKAGIRVIIITGDYGPTAKAIGKQINLVNEKTKIITGVELNKISNSELKQILNKKESMIFARVAPDHKKRIVDILKTLDEVVAVTGDGVNDAPALKRADIGIAMGITGTDVSKEAANMVLTDDSFASIVTAVEEGRRIYQNLKKFVWYIFSCNIGELTTIFVAILLGIPAPLTAVLILMIDLGTDVLPALALGIDHREPELMKKPPRNPKTHIMQKAFVGHFVFLGIFIGLTVISMYLYDLYQLGWQWGEKLSSNDPIHLHASTMAFATLVLIQMVNAFNARSKKFSIFTLKSNYYLWGSVVISTLMVLTMVHQPWFQDKLHTVSLSPKEWTIIILTSLSVLLLEEIRKLIMKKNYSALAFKNIL